VFQTADDTRPEGPVPEETEDGAAPAVPKSKELDERSINVAKAYARFSTARLPVGLKGQDGSYMAREEYEIVSRPDDQPAAVATVGL